MSEAELSDSGPPCDKARSESDPPHKGWSIGRRLRAMRIALIGPDEQLYQQPAKYDSDKKADEAFAKRRQGLIERLSRRS